MFKFENKKKPLISKKEFVIREIQFVLFSLGIIFISMLIGVFGYHYFGELNYIDSILNASMILTGMGPVNPMQTDAAKLFASFYALYSGIAFLTVSGIIFAPFIHRFLHKLHFDEEK